MATDDVPSGPLTDAQYELLRRLGVTREDLAYLKENRTMNERTDHAAEARSLLTLGINPEGDPR